MNASPCRVFDLNPNPNLNLNPEPLFRAQLEARRVRSPSHDRFYVRCADRECERRQIMSMIMSMIKKFF